MGGERYRGKGKESKPENGVKIIIIVESFEGMKNMSLAIFEEDI